MQAIRNIKFSSNTLRNTCQQLRNFTSQPNYEKSIVNITLLGRVGKDPEQRISGDNSMTSFSVATNHNYKGVNGDRARFTVWHEVVVFKDSLGSNLLQNLKKGQRTLITGRISYAQVFDDNGVPKQVMNIVADDVVLIQS